MCQIHSKPFKILKFGYLAFKVVTFDTYTGDFMSAFQYQRVSYLKKYEDVRLSMNLSKEISAGYHLACSLRSAWKVARLFGDSIMLAWIPRKTAVSHGATSVLTSQIHSMVASTQILLFPVYISFKHWKWIFTHVKCLIKNVYPE